MDFRYIIPIGPMLLGLAILGIGFSRPSPSKHRLDPEAIITRDSYDYIRKAEIYTAQGEKEKALATCLEIVDATSESDSERCQLDVYDEFDDIDNVIRIYEKQYREEIVDGDSGALTQHVLEGLREKRDQKQ